MASNLVNVNLCYIKIELCIAQLGTQVRGNILAVSILGAALPYSAVWYRASPLTSIYNCLALDNKSVGLRHAAQCTVNANSFCNCKWHYPSIVLSTLLLSTSRNLWYLNNKFLLLNM